MKHVAELRNTYADEEIVIVAPGVSLMGFPWNVLEPLTTIAVNYSIFAPVAFTYWFMSDYSDSTKKILETYHGSSLLVSTNKSTKPDYIANKTRDVKGYSIHKGLFYCRSRILPLAIQFAMLLGARCISLLGCDCYRLKDQKYFMKVEPSWIPLHNEDLEELCDGRYTTLSLRKTGSKLRQMNALGVFGGVAIINYSEYSLVTCFEKRSLSEFVETHS